MQKQVFDSRANAFKNKTHLPGTLTQLLIHAPTFSAFPAVFNSSLRLASAFPLN
jgi:hypothetical protein